MGIRIYFISQGWSGEVGRIRHKASLANTHDRDVLFQGRTHRASAAAKSHLELACARRIRHACACVSHARKSLNSMSASLLAVLAEFPCMEDSDILSFLLSSLWLRKQAHHSGEDGIEEAHGCEGRQSDYHMILAGEVCWESACRPSLPSTAQSADSRPGWHKVLRRCCLLVLSEAALISVVMSPNSPRVHLRSSTTPFWWGRAMTW